MVCHGLGLRLESRKEHQRISGHDTERGGGETALMDWNCLVSSVFTGFFEDLALFLDIRKPLSYGNMSPLGNGREGRQTVSRQPHMLGSGVSTIAVASMFAFDKDLWYCFVLVWPASLIEHQVCRVIV